MDQIWITNGGDVMEGLRKKLSKEENRLVIICSDAEKRLKEVPEGSLRIGGCRSRPQYYHYFSGGDNNGVYISRKNEKLIKELAQKAYDRKIIRLTKKRLKQIKRMLKDYDDNEIENIFIKEGKERQKFICPAEPTWEQTMAAWISKDYKKKEFEDGAPLILTERGERVRSKSEKIMADYFYANGINYKYECPLYLEDFGVVYPDFTFLSKKMRMEIYWEHNGMMGENLYAQNAVRKINAYIRNGIYPGERLIITYETDKTILDMEIVKMYAEKYLL